MFFSEVNERSRSKPLCDFRLGTVASSDHETPLTDVDILSYHSDVSVESENVEDNILEFEMIARAMAVTIDL